MTLCIYYILFLTSVIVVLVGLCSRFYNRAKIANKDFCDIARKYREYPYADPDIYNDKT